MMGIDFENTYVCIVRHTYRVSLVNGARLLTKIPVEDVMRPSLLKSGNRLKGANNVLVSLLDTDGSKGARYYNLVRDMLRDQDRNPSSYLTPRAKGYYAISMVLLVPISVVNGVMQGLRDGIELADDNQLNEWGELNLNIHYVPSDVKVLRAYADRGAVGVL